MLLAHDEIDVNQGRTDDSATPLYAACYHGHTAIVAMLLARDGIDVNQARTDDSATLLYTACYHGHTAIVAMLLARDEINVNRPRADDGATPLYVACDYGHTGVVAMLLARDDIDASKATLAEGSTPLFVACNHGHAEICKRLMARDGVDVNQARTSDGVTPLYTACDQGHTAIVTMLLMHDGIDVHKVDDEGMTPVHSAALNGHLHMAWLLAVHGVSLTAVDNDGDTAASIAGHRFATGEGKATLAEWLAAVASWSPLRIAAGCRMHKEVAFLLRRGRIDPDDPAATSIQSIMEVVATSKAKPAALPWQNAPPICKATIKLVADATCGWHRTTHWLHHAGVRNAVFAVMVVALRLERGVAVAAVPLSPAAPSDQPSKPRAGWLTRAVPAVTAAVGTTVAVEVAAPTPLPVLPIEIWMYSMRFAKRSWWIVLKENA